MLYPEIFKSHGTRALEHADDVHWDKFDPALLSDEQAQTIKMNAITEWAALPATEMFLRDNRSDSDFSAFMSVWFFRRTEARADADRIPAAVFARTSRPRRPNCTRCAFRSTRRRCTKPMMLHFCGEIRLNHWYRCAAEWHTEPVIKTHLRPDRARRSAPRRRLPAIHEARQSPGTAMRPRRHSQKWAC